MATKAIATRQILSGTTLHVTWDPLVANSDDGEPESKEAKNGKGN